MPSQAKPNILVIMTDQQHDGMLSCTGNTWLHTPAMDRLARDGVRFSRAYATNPVCLPSRVSMATGHMPSRFGIAVNSDDGDFPPGAGERSIGAMMYAAGYDTYHGGKVHMPAVLAPHATGYRVVHDDQREGLPPAFDRFVREPRDKPFFAVASLINPHDVCFIHAAKTPGHPHKMASVDKLYEQACALDESELPPLPDNFEPPADEPPAIDANLSRTAITPAILMRAAYSERDWRIFRWIYCRLTEHVDRHVADLLRTLDETGVADNTLVIFLSDHGDMDATHRLASKMVFYEGSSHVPLMMRLPGTIPAGHVEPTLASIGLDLLPTLCDFAGVAPPDDLPGVSLRAAATGGCDASARAYVVAENRFGRMLRTDRYKYCVYVGNDALRESLVDLNADPGEMHNLAADTAHAATLNAHRAHLCEWIEQVGDTSAKTYAIAPAGT